MMDTNYCTKDFVCLSSTSIYHTAHCQSNLHFSVFIFGAVFVHEQQQQKIRTAPKTQSPQRSVDA